MKLTTTWLIWRPEWGLMLGWTRGPIPAQLFPASVPGLETRPIPGGSCGLGLHLVWTHSRATYALFACSILPLWGVRRLIWVRALRVGAQGTWQPVSLGHDMEAG